MTELRSSERLIRLHKLRFERQANIHIKVGTVKLRAGSDPLHIGDYYKNVMACGRKGFGQPMPGRRDANRATCPKCLERYQPKKGQPQIDQKPGRVASGESE